MDISKINNTQNILSNIYNVSNQPRSAFESRESESKINGVDSVNTQDRSVATLQNVNLARIEDRFSPSQEMQKAREIGAEVSGGFRNNDSFMNLANTLKRENLISENEKVAMEYLGQRSPKLSFDEFEKIARDDNHSKEMRGLMDSVVHKMKYVDSVNGGDIL